MAVVYEKTKLLTDKPERFQHGDGYRRGKERKTDRREDHF